MSAVVSPAVNSPRQMTNAQLDQLSINCIRTLSIDAVQQAKSGHPGTPMALAPLELSKIGDLLNCDLAILPKKS
jgi:transketolase